MTIPALSVTGLTKELFPETTLPDAELRRFEHVLNGRQHPIEQVVLPRRKTTGSAGYDFIMPCSLCIPAGESVKFKTDIKVRMQPDDVLLLVIRSSLGILHSIELPNGVAVIDSDYYNNPENEGNILAVLRNTSDEDFVLRKGDGYMQGLFVSYKRTSDDRASECRIGGIGSTNGIRQS